MVNYYTISYAITIMFSCYSTVEAYQVYVLRNIVNVMMILNITHTMFVEG